jgi:hypothetical protein
LNLLRPGPQPAAPAAASSKRAVSIATIIVAAIAVLGFACSQISLCATKKSIRETSQYSGGLLGEYNQTMKTASLRANVFSWAWLLSLGGLAAFLQHQRKRKLAGVKTLPMSAAASAGAVVFLILVYILLMILT